MQLRQTAGLADQRSRYRRPCWASVAVVSLDQSRAEHLQGNDSAADCVRVSRLVLRMLIAHFFNLLQHLPQVIGFRRLQWRIRYVRLQLFEPQLLPERHDTKSIVHKGSARSGYCSAEVE